MASHVSRFDHVLSPDSRGVILAIMVVPGASRSEIVGLHGDALRVRVTAPPQDGRANTAVVKMLGDALRCPVDLLSGARSRRKRVLLRNVAQEDVALRINSLLG